MQDVGLDALVRASRWVARTPFVDPDDGGPLDRHPVTSPFHGALQLEDYQLVPLMKALRMPRVSLLLADDVGLGKTIEAGLILSELLLRRRVRRMLVLTPASLRLQWRDELWQKFSLHFDIVDRDATARLRRQLGMDANPWRSHSRTRSVGRDRSRHTRSTTGAMWRASGTTRSSGRTACSRSSARLTASR